MIKFVNAKINIGLNIVGKRDDGYHNLETVFYPVGIESGMPHQPEPFDDILEVNYSSQNLSGCRFQFMGRKVECAPEKNLVVRAATKFLKAYSARFDDLERFGMFEITLDKHLPEGAGLGGGSADATFTIATLNEVTGGKFEMAELIEMTASIGADCPFFIYNRPCFAEGIGEILKPVSLNLKGKYIVIVKPEIYISTKEAFAGVTPSKPAFDLRLLPELPIEQWKEYVINDFEKSVFPYHPELLVIKNEFYIREAIYASMSGSGSSVYGIFGELEAAMQMRDALKKTYEGVWLFGL